MKGDLHIHSSISDCDYSIEEIVKKAKEKGLTHISITDHDTILGLEEALKIGEKYHIKVIPGIEISAYDNKRKRKVHILGYGNLGENVQVLCKNMPEKREALSKRYFNEIQNKGYDISWEDIKSCSGKTGVFKQHIMLNLIKKGYTRNIYGDLYNTLFKKETQIKEMEYIDVFEAVQAIKKDGGVAVIAHPALYKNEELISELVSFGLDGIEVYHPKHTYKDIEKLSAIAKEKNLIITGGTDFHGNMGEEYVEMGSYFCSEESIKNILDKKR